MNVVTPTRLHRVVRGEPFATGGGYPMGDVRWGYTVTFMPFARFDIEASYHRDGGTNDGPCFVADLVWGSGPDERILLVAADTREEMQRDLPDALASVFAAYRDIPLELPGIDWNVISDPTKTEITTSDTQGG